MKNTWIIIPAYNESKNIASVIKKTKKYAKNIIVIDDGSTDNTYSIAKKNKVITLRHIVNIGKGAAMKTGCEYALKKKAKTIIVMDADIQHNPKDIPRFIKELKMNDIAFSYRKFGKTMPAIKRFGNAIINKSVKILFGVKLRDTQNGYRAFKANAYKKIKWNAIDYSVESEMIANTGKHKLKYTEIPIQTIYSDKYKGTTIMDGIKIVVNMILWRLTK